MKLNGLRLLSLLLVSSLNVVSGHKCLNFYPMPKFEMEKFLGLWYGIETTFFKSKCLVYEFYTQKIDNFVDYTATARFQYIFGALEAKTCLRSEMTFTDLNDKYKNHKGKKPSFIVFDTDYVSYAAIYMCTNGKEFKHYVTILSRSEDINRRKLIKLHLDIIKTHDLQADLKFKIVDHKNCKHEKPDVISYDQNAINNGKAYVSIKFKPWDVFTPKE